MSKPRSKIADYSVYLIVRLFVCVLQTLSLQVACAVADALAWLAYHVDRRHRLVALENLRLAFGDGYTESQRDAIVRSVYRHFCRLLIEIVHLPRRVHLQNWKKFFDISQAPQVVERLLGDQPVMIVTGHFGNWELAGYVISLLGFTSYAVARPLDNPYLDDYLRRFREHTGQKLLAKKGYLEHMQEILSDNGAIATLADQDAGQRGLFVDFFGRPASTHKAIALLSLQYHVPLAVILSANVGAPLRYCVQVQDLILPEEYDGRPDAVRAITQRFSAAIERGVRRAPDQYFWLHRRWKHQPAKREKRAA